jgi:hypothetical protein
VEVVMMQEASKNSMKTAVGKAKARRVEMDEFV